MSQIPKLADKIGYIQNLSCYRAAKPEQISRFLPITEDNIEMVAKLISDVELKKKMFSVQNSNIRSLGNIMSTGSCEMVLNVNQRVYAKCLSDYGPKIK